MSFRRQKVKIHANANELPYSTDVSSDVWVGAVTTLAGAALGGVISFALSRQQLSDARLQRKEQDVREQRRRSEDRRFEIYSDFLLRTRSCRNALQSYYLHEDNTPSVGELDVLLQAANDASALVFLLAETEDTYQGCRAALAAIRSARNMIHRTGNIYPDDPWEELRNRFGRAMREFQIAARHELGVSGPDHLWTVADRTSPEST